MTTPQLCANRHYALCLKSPLNQWKFPATAFHIISMVSQQDFHFTAPIYTSFHPFTINKKKLGVNTLDQINEEYFATTNIPGMSNGRKYLLKYEILLLSTMTRNNCHICTYYKRTFFKLSTIFYNILNKICKHPPVSFLLASSLNTSISYLLLVEVTFGGSEMLLSCDSGMIMCSSG